MTPREFFTALEPLITPALDEVFHRRDLCVLATRVAIETANYFGIAAEAAPVKCMVYNATFARHIESQDVDMTQPCTSWGDDSWGVGIGIGAPKVEGKWDGHLIVLADGCFGDFTLGQAERPQRNIITGRALVGPWSGASSWRVYNEAGTVVGYHRIRDESWRRARDWQHEARRRPIVGKLIRAMRNQTVTSSVA